MFNVNVILSQSDDSNSRHTMDMSGALQLGDGKLMLSLGPIPKLNHPLRQMFVVIVRLRSGHFPSVPSLRRMHHLAGYHAYAAPSVQESSISMTLPLAVARPYVDNHWKSLRRVLSPSILQTLQHQS